MDAGLCGQLWWTLQRCERNHVKRHASRLDRSSRFQPRLICGFALVTDIELLDIVSRFVNITGNSEQLCVWEEVIVSAPDVVCQQECRRRRVLRRHFRAV